MQLVARPGSWLVADVTPQRMMTGQADSSYDVVNAEVAAAVLL